MRLPRGAATLGLAVAVVCAGGVFVFAEAAAAPPPAQVLGDAARFTRDARGWSYTAAESISVANGGGGEIVRHRVVTGSVAGGAAGGASGGAAGGASGLAAVDMRVSEGERVAEFVAAPPAAGLFIRLGDAANAISAARWQRVDGYRGYAASSIDDAIAITDAVLGDRSVDGSILPRLLAGARRPARRGTAVRHLNIVIDPLTVFGADGRFVDSMSGELSVDGGNRPTAIVLHVRSAPATIDVTFRPRWGKAPTITAPPAGDVVGPAGLEGGSPMGWVRLLGAGFGLG